LFTQRLFVVHRSVSAQFASVLQQFPTTGSCWQPSGATHESVVHASLSLQLGAGPPTQLPPEQWSLVVHSLSSLQAIVLFACVQPVAALQPSFVQMLLSLQSGADPPTQLPPAHASFVVQALLSSHGSLLFTCVQPVAGLQPSSVQPLPSLQLIGVPAQTSFVQ
jgi:hypothetical protein